MAIIGVTDSLIATLLWVTGKSSWNKLNDPFKKALSDTQKKLSGSVLPFPASRIESILDGRANPDRIKVFQKIESFTDSKKLAVALLDFENTSLKDVPENLEKATQFVDFFKEAFAKRLSAKEKFAHQALLALAQIDLQLTREGREQIINEIKNITETLPRLSEDARTSREILERIEEQFQIGLQLQKPDLIKEQKLSTSSNKKNALFLIPFVRNLFLRHTGGFLRSLDAHFQSNKFRNHSPINIAGLSGTGKTAVAVEYAYRNANNYPGGVFFIVAENSLYSIIRKFLFQLMDREQLDIDIEKDSSGSLVRYFITHFENRKKSLIIIDNVSNPDDISRLHSINSDIIITSQSKSLPYPFIDIDEIMDSDDSEKALDILISYAQVEKTELYGPLREAAKRICETVGNLPLALEIAGSIARDQDFISLKDNLYDIEKRKAYTHYKGLISVEAAFSLLGNRYNNPLSLEVLILLSYLNPEDIIPIMVKDILGLALNEVNEALLSLSKFSLIKKNGEGGYTIHRLVQSTARELDNNNEIGLKYIDWLIDETQKIWGTGRFKDATFLSNHIVSIVKLSRSNTDINSFPPEDKIYALNNYLIRTLHLSQVKLDISQITSHISSVCINRILNSGEISYSRISERYHSIAMNYWYLGYYKEALESIEQALEFAKRNIDDIPEKIPEILSTKGLILKNLGKREFAIDSFHQALKYDLANLDNNLISSIKLKDDEGNGSSISADQLKYLIENVKKVIEGILVKEMHNGFFEEKSNLFANNFAAGLIKDKLKPIGSLLRDISKHINNYAVVLREQKKYSEAKPLFEIALSITEITMGYDDRTTAFHLSNLAIVKNGLGLYREANELFNEELQIIEKYYSKKHQAYSIHLQRWGNALAIQEKHELAVTKYSQSIEIFKKVGNLDHPELLKQIISKADALLSLCDKNGAIVFLSTEYDFFVKNIGEDHPNSKKIKELLEKM